jgi:hypothetical protein
MSGAPLGRTFPGLIGGVALDEIVGGSRTTPTWGFGDVVTQTDGEAC